MLEVAEPIAANIKDIIKRLPSRHSSGFFLDCFFRFLLFFKNKLEFFKSVLFEARFTQVTPEAKH